MKVRAQPLVVTALACLTCISCGRQSQTAPNIPPETTPTALKASGRVINALTSDAIGAAAVAPSGLNGVSTDASGGFVVSASLTGNYLTTVTRGSFVDRRTLLAIPNEGATISMIPSSFDLSAFEEFAPRIGGLQRWIANPTLQVLTNVVDYLSAGDSFREFTVTDHTLSAANRACLTNTLQAALSDLTGGRLNFSDVRESTLSIGSRFRTDTTPEGTIVVMAAATLDLAGRAIGYASSASSHTLNRGAIFLREVAPYCDPANGPHLIGHELGHALGYAFNHVTMVPSIMSVTPATTTQGVSGFDRDAIVVIYQRPPGNRALDADPSDSPPLQALATARRVFLEPIR